ncbi:HEAT repeat domain-containing protein [Actinomadura bangladeshensis]|uniref:HEAT repeat domain-containing protein n=1 Tax=Actinomadura bangladeshensis TaxID=453573 RepID=A0A4R4PC16_9ACTN|nr:HEAT repeat domain-containing protein [Actinomadura bangladeshensis]TDC18650.1 hypothetical protein E1284_05645 [Actinomadura bangladeshensis]
MTLLDGLDEIDWTALGHAYGEAGDVPGLLRGIAQGLDPENALDDLEGKIYHQGGMVFSAARAALPYLVALAGDPAVPVRPGLLELIGLLVGEANTVSRSWVDDGWPDAWAAALPRVLSLLDDPDVAVRRVLASTLSDARADADAVVPALRSRWDAEDDGAVRLGIIIATGELAGGCTAGVLPEALVWLRDLRRHDDAQIRMAAELALAKAVRTQRPELGTLVAAVRGDISVWRDTPWVGDMPADLREFYGGRAARLLGWLGRRLEDDTAARTELAAAFLGSGDGDRRIGAVQIAADVLSAARSPVVRLLPGLVQGSTDGSSAVRAYATHLLAALDEGDADLLAARLDDHAPLSRHSDGRIADLAAWGLARRNDPRCLPRLLDRLAGDLRFGGDGYGPSGPFTTMPPTMRTLLGPLSGHAGALLPAIRARLDEPDIARGLVEALAEWGPAASAAVPELAALIGTDATIEAARALAAIGPAAADAAPALAGAPDSGSAWVARQADVVLPWALWKVTGDPARLLAALDEAFDGRSREPLRRAADLGPLAAAHAGRLRALLDVRDDWTRVEAAHAYHRVTGDAETASSVLDRELYAVAAGEYLPVRWTAVRHLAEMRPAFPGVRRAAQEILSSDRRHHYGTGWRAFTEDRELRDLASQILSA